MLSEHYWPTFWCFGAWAQTVVRALIRSRPSVGFRRETLETPDGGIVCLDWFDNDTSTIFPATRPTVLILPGLTGGSETSYSRHLVLLGEKLGVRNLEVFESHLGNLPFDIHHALKARTIREFDERFTSPTFGYRNYEEYYSAATLHTKPLHTIRVPVLCLNAADDPFSPLHAIPLASLAQNPLVSMVLTSYGGHIGFVEGLTIHQTNYMERLFVQFTKGIFELVEKGKLKDMVVDAHS